MPQSKLVIQERGLNKFAVCPRCNTEFKSSLINSIEAEAEIKRKFDNHRCKPEDVNQSAARIVREATERE